MSEFRLTPKQVEANRLLGSASTHVMLRGGSRSGKTFLIVRALVTRALAHQSRHCILRYRFNHLKGSIIYDTLPKVMDLCFPGVAKHCTLDKSDWFYKLPNRSEIWFGGLDEKERTEKVLGQEHCVDPAALVLTADLRWLPARQISPGDELIGFPESLEGNQTLRRSIVERSDIIQADKYRVVTDRGETVVSGHHLFVIGGRGHNPLKWRAAEKLKVGDWIKFATKPWASPSDWEAGWMAGILDGEGCISGTKTYTHCSIAQNAGPILDRICTALQRFGVRFSTNEHPRGKCFSVRCLGIWNALRLLGIARPVRLLPKAALIWENRRPFNGHNDNHFAVVTSVEPLGVGPVVALGTSTKTFICDGFLGHNSTLFLNECSQIPWSSRNMALTRLAQRTPLRLKFFYDCNPPGDGHWTAQVFIHKRDPDSRKPLADPGNYAQMLVNPADNADNLPPEYLSELQNLPERMRKRFWAGEFQADVDNALWSLESIEKARVEKLPDLQRVVIAVDPSGCSGEEDDRSDEVGIVVCALGADGNGYVLEDLSGRFGPAGWGRIVAAAFDRHDADCVVAETNFGGAMVGEVMRTARPRTPFKEVKASRGKAVRAEPISLLFEQGKAKFFGEFQKLESQLCEFTTAGYVGRKSPDRADAMVWGLTEIFPKVARGATRHDVKVEGLGSFNPHRFAVQAGK